MSPAFASLVLAFGLVVLCAAFVDGFFSGQLTSTNALAFVLGCLLSAAGLASLADLFKDE